MSRGNFYAALGLFQLINLRADDYPGLCDGVFYTDYWRRFSSLLAGEFLHELGGLASDW